MNANKVEGKHFCRECGGELVTGAGMEEISGYSCKQCGRREGKYICQDCGHVFPGSEVLVLDVEKDMFGVGFDGCPNCQSTNCSWIPPFEED